jgi:hypothetical protein
MAHQPREPSRLNPLIDILYRDRLPLLVLDRVVLLTQRYVFSLLFFVIFSRPPVWHLPYVFPYILTSPSWFLRAWFSI